MRKMYEIKKEEYKRDTDKELEMTEDEFIDLMKHNLHAAAVDVVFFASLFAITILLRALMPDTPDDEDARITNVHKFMLKAR